MCIGAPAAPAPASVPTVLETESESAAGVSAVRRPDNSILLDRDCFRRRPNAQLPHDDPSVGWTVPTPRARRLEGERWNVMGRDGMRWDEMG